MLELAIARQFELTQQLLCPRVVPSWIERFQIREKVSDRHPLRHLLVFRHITDLLKLARRKAPRIDAQRLGASRGRLVNIHQDLDRSGFPRAIGPDQREHTTLWNIKTQPIQRLSPAKPLRKVDRSQYTHFLPPSSLCQ